MAHSHPHDTKSAHKPVPDKDEPVKDTFHPDATPMEVSKSKVHQESKPISDSLPLTFLLLYDCATHQAMPWPAKVQEWCGTEHYRQCALQTLKGFGSMLPIPGLIERFIDEVLKEVGGK